MKAEVTYKSDRDVWFKASSAELITEDHALRAQREAGYHPAGYGFYKFRTGKDPVSGLYVATWHCQASCD